MVATHENEFVFLPLGGVGKMGMNLAAYGFGSKKNYEWLLVDMGVSFAGPEFLGVDLILPDIQFLESKRDSIRGLILTHAHEDHYGAVFDLWPRLQIPVYCTPFTAGLLEKKGQSAFEFCKIPLNILKSGDVVQISPFMVEGIAVNHSIPDALSLAITTPLGKVIHTGDWKIDQAPSLEPATDEKRFRRLGKEGVLALMCDSTNALQDGIAPSEKEVQESLYKIIVKAKGQVVVTTFASNIGRIRSVALASEAAGRRVLLVGRSLKRSISVAHDLNYIEDLEPFITEDDYKTFLRKKAVLLVTGSQGEPHSALAKLSRKEMKNIALSPGDTVIYSSRSIPGNERAILDVQNRLIDQGVTVITNSEALVHVSGHPLRSELLQMYDWVKPKILVPVHGDIVHLSAHATLARQAGIQTVVEIRNGDMLRLAPEPVKIVDRVFTGCLYKDGRLIGDEDELGINERRKLSYVGHIAIFLHINSKNLLDDVSLTVFGLPRSDGKGEILKNILRDSIEKTINNIPRAKRKDGETIRQAARRAARTSVNEIWGKKPVCTVFLHQSK